MSSPSTLARCGAVARLLVIAGAVATGACSQELPPRTTLQLMRDPAVRDAVLLRCNQLQGAALRDAECRNVREAVDRLAAEAQEEQPGEAKEAAEAADESFQRAREARRAHEERERRRREAEASEKVDPYTMPLVPPEQPTASVPAASLMSAAAPPASES